jgi:hypothetical protein
MVIGHYSLFGPISLMVIRHQRLFSPISWMVTGHFGEDAGH